MPTMCWRVEFFYIRHILEFDCSAYFSPSLPPRGNVYKNMYSPNWTYALNILTYQLLIVDFMKYCTLKLRWRNFWTWRFVAISGYRGISVDTSTSAVVRTFKSLLVINNWKIFTTYDWKLRIQTFNVSLGSTTRGGSSEITSSSQFLEY